MEIFDYDNILLLPRKCRVESRSECDASVELGKRRMVGGQEDMIVDVALDLLKSVEHERVHPQPTPSEAA